MSKLISVCFLVFLGTAIADRDLDLWNAAKKSNYLYVKEALDWGANPNWQNETPNPNWEGYSALHWACWNNDLEIVNLLLDNGAHVNLPTNDDEDPLYLASGKGHLEIVNKLLERGAFVNHMGNELGALHAAAHMNYVGIMEALLNAGADIDQQSNGRTPLYFAAKKGNTDAVITLINHGADLDIQAWNGGMTALMVAIENGYESIAKALIEANANLEIGNDLGLTALHISAKYNQPEISQLLLQKGADPYKEDKVGRTPRDIAEEKGVAQNLDSFSALDTLEDVIEVVIENEAGVAPINTEVNLNLWVATKYGYLDDVQDALNAGADPDWVNPEGNFDNWAPLHLAADNNYQSIVIALLDNGAYVNQQSYSDLTPLKLASRAGNAEIVHLLIERGASVNLKVSGYTALISAAVSSESNRLEIIEALMDAGANPDLESNGRTALYMASEKGHTDAVIRLINYGADLNIQSWYGEMTALMIAVQEGWYEIAAALIDANANRELTTEGGLTALHIAAKYNQPAIAQLLLQRGADPNQQDNYGRTPSDIAAENGDVQNLDSFSVLVDVNLDLWVAAKNGKLDDVEDALSAGADPEWINPKDNWDKWTPLHWAAYNNNASIVVALLDNGAYINEGTHYDSNPLTLASQAGNIEVVNLLIGRGADVNWRGIGFTASQWNGEMTALMIAVKNGMYNITAELLDANANIELTNERGLTALHIAAKYHQPSIAQLLLQRGADPNQQDNYGRTPSDIAAENGDVQNLDSFSVLSATITTDANLDLWVAAKNGNLADVYDALNAGADPNWVKPGNNRDQWTALHWAANTNNPSIVIALLDNGAYINEGDHSDRNPLIIASQDGHIETVNVLIEKGAAVDWMTTNKTALMWAAMRNHLDVMDALLAAGANIDEQAFGMTALFMASDRGNIDAVMKLLNHGADLDIQAHVGDMTALMTAIETGRVEIAEKLIAAGANIDLATQGGLTALHIAAMNNEFTIAQILLQAAADPNREDYEGRTPRQIAEENGYTHLDRFSRVVNPWDDDGLEVESEVVDDYYGDDGVAMAGKTNYACIYWARLWKNLRSGVETLSYIM